MGASSRMILSCTHNVYQRPSQPVCQRGETEQVSGVSYVSRVCYTEHIKPCCAACSVQRRVAIRAQRGAG